MRLWRALIVVGVALAVVTGALGRFVFDKGPSKNVIARFHDCTSPTTLPSASGVTLLPCTWPAHPVVIDRRP